MQLIFSSIFLIFFTWCLIWLPLISRLGFNKHEKQKNKIKNKKIKQNKTKKQKQKTKKKHPKNINTLIHSNDFIYNNTYLHQVGHCKLIAESQEVFFTSNTCLVWCLRRPEWRFFLKHFLTTICGSIHAWPTSIRWFHFESDLVGGRINFYKCNNPAYSVDHK